MIMEKAIVGSTNARRGWTSTQAIRSNFPDWKHGFDIFLSVSRAQEFAIGRDRIHSRRCHHMHTKQKEGRNQADETRRSFVETVCGEPLFSACAGRCMCICMHAKGNKKGKRQQAKNQKGRMRLVVARKTACHSSPPTAISLRCVGAGRFSSNSGSSSSY